MPKILVRMVNLAHHVMEKLMGLVTFGFERC
jgi:hypothetical protein